MMLRKATIAAVLAALTATGIGSGTAFAKHHRGAHTHTGSTSVGSTIANIGNGADGGNGGDGGNGADAFNRF